MKKAKTFKRKMTKGKRSFSGHKNRFSLYKTSEWQKFRFRFLHRNPKCYACGVDSKVVDHVVPARLDVEKYFWETTNMIPLCTVCHNTITAKFDRHALPKTEEKMLWIDKKRKENNCNVKVKIVKREDEH